ncbi:pao retrotransposon peptidase domain-containing protein [Phthorimaea operculella]|nr:pao retrotransposon peptidase domain-containing protein [Phthorimaea operculella]
MYFQLKVKPEHQTLQRILYRFNTQSPIDVYQFDRVAFGLKCSPYLALRVIRQLAQDESQTFPNLVEIVANYSYMDDFLTSLPDEEEALKLYSQLIELFKRGGFNLTKWISNSQKFLEQIPKDSRASKTLSFDADADPHTKIIGLHWNPVEDNFFFSAKSAPLNSETQYTKRSVLSTTASLFDPLGLLAPAVALMKLIIQECWRRSLDWDEPLPIDLKNIWEKILHELPCLSKLKIPRYVGLFPGASVSLIGFADSSEKCYGAAVYVRVGRMEDEASAVSLLCAKSRVASGRQTLARLELCAAHLLAKLIITVHNIITKRVQIDKIMAFSDSTITLAWINSSPHKWQTFVANRVAEIQELLAPPHWFHVPGEHNISDLITRPVTPAKLIENDGWFHGPDWMLLPQPIWPVNIQNDVPQHIPEAKLVSFIHVSEPHPIDILSERVSKWSILLNIIVYILRFMKKLKSKGRITLTDLASAETYIFKHVQNKHFASDINNLNLNKKCSTALQKLNPSQELRSSINIEKFIISVILLTGLKTFGAYFLPHGLGVASFPRDRVPGWRIGECSADMPGRREIKYLPRTTRPEKDTPSTNPGCGLLQSTWSRGCSYAVCLGWSAQKGWRRMSPDCLGQRRHPCLHQRHPVKIQPWRQVTTGRKNHSQNSSPCANMKVKYNKRTITTRASPVSDGDDLNANLNLCDNNARAYPQSDEYDKNKHSQTKTTNRLRLGTWNLGTMTGRSAELSEGSQFLDDVRLYLREDAHSNKSADKMWSDFETFCLSKARLTLGVSRGGIATHKDTTWWNDDVKQVIKAKRESFKMWQNSHLEEDRETYKSMKAVAKSAVAQARASSRRSFYEKLDSAPNENAIFKIAKQRHKATLDIKFNKYIKDDHGQLLTSNDAINKRWKVYYDQLLNEEFPSEELPTLATCHLRQPGIGYPGADAQGGPTPANLGKGQEEEEEVHTSYPTASEGGLCFSRGTLEAEFTAGITAAICNKSPFIKQITMSWRYQNTDREAITAFVYSLVAVKKKKAVGRFARVLGEKRSTFYAALSYGGSRSEAFAIANSMTTDDYELFHKAFIFTLRKNDENRVLFEYVHQVVVWNINRSFCLDLCRYEHLILLTIPYNKFQNELRGKDLLTECNIFVVGKFASFPAIELNGKSDEIKPCGPFVLVQVIYSFSIAVARIKYFGVKLGSIPTEGDETRRDATLQCHFQAASRCNARRRSMHLEAASNPDETRRDATRRCNVSSGDVTFGRLSVRFPRSVLPRWEKNPTTFGNSIRKKSKVTWFYLVPMKGR